MHYKTGFLLQPNVSSTGPSEVQDVTKGILQLKRAIKHIVYKLHQHVTVTEKVFMSI
jgi:hypothetical protein